MKIRYLVTIAAVLLSLAGWHFFLVRPQLEKKENIDANLTESRKRLTDLRRLMVQFHEYFETRRELAHARESFMSKLYSRDELIRLFDKFETLAERQELLLVEISPSVEELLALNKKFVDDHNPHPLDITIKFRGDLKSAGEYIKSIETESFYKGANFCKVSNPVDGRHISDVDFGFRVILGTAEES